MFFDSLAGLGRVVLVSLLAYAALILVVRLSGKRSLAKLNAFDLVVTVALGSTLATVLLSKDVALAEGVLAFAMLAGLQWLVSTGSLRWSLFRKLVRSDARLMFHDGRYCQTALREERVTRSEIDQAIRAHGFGRLEDVAAVVLESNGNFSVIGADKASGESPELSALRRVKGNCRSETIENPPFSEQSRG